MPQAPIKTKKNEASIERPFKCEVDVSFPTAIDAKRAFEVLSVDDEIGNRVKKEYVICATNSEGITVPCPTGKVLRVYVYFSFFPHMFAFIFCLS